MQGKAIIQTYLPDNYAIRAAVSNNYEVFYNKEIEYRRVLSNPPFSQLAVLTYSNTNSAVCKTEAGKLKNELLNKQKNMGIPNLRITGPVPAYIERLKGNYRWQIMVRGIALSSFLKGLPTQRGWQIEIDPFGV